MRPGDRVVRRHAARYLSVNRRMLMGQLVIIETAAVMRAMHTPSLGLHHRYGYIPSPAPSHRLVDRICRIGRVSLCASGGAYLGGFSGSGSGSASANMSIVDVVAQVEMGVRVGAKSTFHTSSRGVRLRCRFVVPSKRAGSWLKVV